MDNVKQQKMQICRRKTAEKAKVISTMLVVTQKHMQNADWVYYPFKSSHVYTWSIVSLNNCRQHLHKCMICTIGKEKKKKKHSKNVDYNK